MEEVTVAFQTDDSVRLEGLFCRNSGPRGVVVTHPHPLYGGDMYNPVVETVVHAYQRKGCATLRFNFRGVGGSEGHFEDGAGERQDVRGAVHYLRNQGIRQVELAGYSFGAWVNAHVGCEGPAGAVTRMVMVSPPVNFLDFAGVGTIPCLRLVINGDEDEFAGIDRVRFMVDQWNPDAQISVVPDTDHFYSGALRDLETVLKDFVAETERGNHVSTNDQ